MKPSVLLPGLLAATTLFIATPATAQTTALDHGKAEYESNCAGCHGVSGRGDGHFAQFLNRAPSDLTLLSRRNGGVFPMQRVSEVIDGRTAVAGHGAAGEMPIWGSTYAAKAKTDPVGRIMFSESFVRNRIAVLADYLYRIQQP